MSNDNTKLSGPLQHGKCSVPMWCAGVPDGRCDALAFGVYIDGPRFRDGWTGELRRRDGGYIGYVPDLACPVHGGPQPTGPRVFQDGFSENGRPMWCAVYEDFENLQESPAEFDERPWVAIERLLKTAPRAARKGGE